MNKEYNQTKINNKEQINQFFNKYIKNINQDIKIFSISGSSMKMIKDIKIETISELTINYYNFTDSQWIEIYLKDDSLFNTYYKQYDLLKIIINLIF